MSTHPHHYQQQDFDTMSTMSTASTLVPPSSSSSATPRTTLTGNPITYTHDPLSNLNSGTGCGNVGANTLPPGYTDASLVHIPIRTAEYLHAAPSTASEPPSEIKREPSGKGGVWDRIAKRVSGSHESRGRQKSGDDDGGLKIVVMSRGEYVKYWVKGEDGKFKAEVMEPEEGRAEWLRRALERQEREGLGKVATRRTQGTLGQAEAFGAAGALISAASIS